MTSIKEIQKTSFADSHRWFEDYHFNHTQHELRVHYALGMCGEVGELANLVKKVNRGDMDWEDAKMEIGEEMADVLTYLLNLAEDMDIDLEAEWASKRRQNELRFG